MTGVGTRKVFEDDRVIVWHFDLEPGEQGKPHTHNLDYVVRVLSGSTLEVSGPDGELLYSVERQAGGALASESRVTRSFRIIQDLRQYQPLTACETLARTPFEKC